MISILLPVYNFDIRQLVADLTAQCESCAIEHEILCFDDGSENRFKEINKEVGKGRVAYQEMTKNLGRSAIRNKLAEAAKYPYLLFMDCDSKVVRSDYIQKYLDHLNPKTVLCGGRAYSPQKPVNKKYFFHWKYGTEREQQSAESRQKENWYGFMTNNFIVPKKLFLKVQFDSSLKQYGHEDTLFGMEMKNRNVPIIHLDNPLEHIGLESAGTFINKTKQGLENLLKLWQQGTPIDAKLLRFFVKIKKMKIGWLIACVHVLCSPFIEFNLKSKSPNLMLFDFYKLGYICWLDRQKPAL